jgi:hypothetical protein
LSDRRRTGEDVDLADAEFGRIARRLLQALRESGACGRVRRAAVAAAIVGGRDVDQHDGHVAGRTPQIRDLRLVGELDFDSGKAGACRGREALQQRHLREHEREVRDELHRCLARLRRLAPRSITPLLTRNKEPDALEV